MIKLISESQCGVAYRKLIAEVDSLIDATRNNLTVIANNNVKQRVAAEVKQAEKKEAIS